MNTEKVAERLQEIMDLADMHAHARIMPGTPRENLPYCILRALVQAALAENETLRTGYDAARREIASLQVQLEAVGAGKPCAKWISNQVQTLNHNTGIALWRIENGKR